MGAELVNKMRVLFCVIFALLAVVNAHEVLARVQKPAPDFTAEAVVDGDFQEISLADFKGKYLVMFFYPLDFTFVCPTEIIAFSENFPKFKELNANVIGISVDSKFTHLAWQNTPRNAGGLGQLNIPLVSDINRKISSDYGVLVEDGADAGVALRGLFIIDDKGVIRSIMINDLPVGRNVAEVLRLVEAFQYSDKHGEVCPMGWTKGSKTITPDPVKAQDYFQTIAE